LAGLATSLIVQATAYDKTSPRGSQHRYHIDTALVIPFRFLYVLGTHETYQKQEA
jgi:hypothetical protein